MPFKKGVSGNSAGRKKGVPNKRGIMAGALDAISAEKGIDVKQAIVAKLVESALEGNPQSIKLIMDRVEPAFKLVSAPIKLNVRLPKNPVRCAEKLIALTIQGQLLPDETKILLEGLKSVLQIKEFAELEQRIIQLEEANV